MLCPQCGHTAGTKSILAGGPILSSSSSHCGSQLEGDSEHHLEEALREDTFLIHEYGQSCPLCDPAVLQLCPSSLSSTHATREQLCFHAISWGSSISRRILSQRDTLVCLQHSVYRICSLFRFFIMIFYFYCSPHDLFVCINLILRFHNLIMGSRAQKEVIKHAHSSNIPALLSTSCLLPELQPLSFLSSFLDSKNS